MATNINSYGVLEEEIFEMNDFLTQMENEVNTTEVEQIIELIKKYEVVLKDDIEEKDLVLNYETFYDQLNEYVINKRNAIEHIEKKISNYPELRNNEKFVTLLEKKKFNTNQMIDCLNKIVERIQILETTSFNNKINELNGMKVKRYDVIDKEMDIINDSMKILKSWCYMNTYSIIFDSKFYGDGSNNVLYDRVIGRSNLYFINFDDNNNVYGGFVGVEINKSNGFIHSQNAFIFSLIKNGEVNNSRYSIKRNRDDAFSLHESDENGVLNEYLYSFGSGDIGVHKVGVAGSSCHCNSYYYRNDYEMHTNVFTGSYFLQKTKLERIFVIQMS